VQPQSRTDTIQPLRLHLAEELDRDVEILGPHPAHVGMDAPQALLGRRQPLTNFIG